MNLNLIAADIQMIRCRCNLIAPLIGTIAKFATLFQRRSDFILITGRVLPQKGIENIFYTFQYVILKFPNVRFIFLLMPTLYQLEDLKNYMQVSSKISEECSG